MLIEKILEHYENLPQTASQNLRMSAAGKCARALAYQYHGVAGTPLNARAKMLFELGDMVETQLSTVAQKYGLTDMQKEVSLVIGGVTIYGHIDGLYENVIVDFKSINDLGFKRVAKGDIDYGHKCQAHCYMKALEKKKFLLFYYNKNISKPHETFVLWDDKIWSDVEKRFFSVINSPPDNLPAREYGANEKGNLPWQCSYCSYCQTCWPDKELLFDKNNKPVLKTKEKENESKPKNKIRK